jgi:hypothetical protein
MIHLLVFVMEFISLSKGDLIKSSDELIAVNETIVVVIKMMNKSSNLSRGEVEMKGTN